MTVAVFAKAPVPGAVKTRLAPALGPEATAALHQRLVRHALATATAAQLGALQLWCAPDAAHPFFADCAREFGASLHAQQGADLGARMAAAFRQSLSSANPLVLIGADCPALSPGRLMRAASALRHADAVFIPAEDGGYVLVGLAREMPGLFEGVAWGGASVMAQTRERLRAAGANWVEQPPLWDVDTPADLERLERSGALGSVVA